MGKRLLARSLASLTRSAFLCVTVPRLVLEVIHEGSKVGELVTAWSQTLAEMPPVTVLFNELEFSQAQEIGARRPDLPVGPVMDFLLDLIDRTVEIRSHLVIGSTNHPGTLRQAFAQPGRFERVVEVAPAYPDDIVSAIEIHAAGSEKRAGHPLFDNIDWKSVVEHYELEGDHLARTKGYESYGQLQNLVSADGGADAAMEFFLNLQIWGTPQQCYEKIVDVQKRIGGRTFNAICSYAGMPWDEAERNLRLFAERVRPELARFEL